MSGFSDSTEGVDIRYVAQLARLHLTDEETLEFQGQLDQVLAYVQQLQEVDIVGVEPTAHAIPLQNVFRRDEVHASLPHEKVMANAPAERQGEFLVPKIVE